MLLSEMQIIINYMVLSLDVQHKINYPLYRFLYLYFSSSCVALYVSRSFLLGVIKHACSCEYESDDYCKFP